MQKKSVEIIQGLQGDILRLQGFKPAPGIAPDHGLGSISDAFPHGTFPLGAIHEFLSARAEEAASTSGFIAGLLAPLMANGGASLWISTARTIFPPALRSFGVQPDRFIFVDLHKERDILWAMEEALKCGALSAVVGELNDFTFKASRRLQLAVEQSRVTGFILRHQAARLNTTACVSRWRISPLPSVNVTTGNAENLPGIGFPHWRVELLRIRNGKPGVWDLRWVDGKFLPAEKFPPVSQEQYREVG